MCLPNFLEADLEAGIVKKVMNVSINEQVCRFQHLIQAGESLEILIDVCKIPYSP